MAIGATTAELLAVASQASQPAFPPKVQPRLGGVDPLGLRQINFDLMDQVLPGLNNVARHIRPFVVVTWAWRRAALLAKGLGDERVAIDLMCDFVDRIEIIYVWSQILRDRGVDLPGRDVVQPLIKSGRYRFGGEDWRKRRNDRKYSTAFTAPITYGPALKSLGWVEPHREHREVLIASPEVATALDTFEGCIGDRLEEPTFCELGEIEVDAASVSRWGEGWALDTPTAAEKRQFAEMLFGDRAPAARRFGVQLALAAARRIGTTDVAPVRAAMAEESSPEGAAPGLESISGAWRRVQVRQLFRLALECLLYWTIRHLEAGPLATPALVDKFISEAGRRTGAKTAADWLDPSDLSGDSAVGLLEQLQAAAAEGFSPSLPARIAAALVLTLSMAPDRPEEFERSDRLPLSRARQEAAEFLHARPEEFITHVLESWVLAQHVYWSVGRGLADARARGKSILRLKVVLDEGGWTLTPGALGQNPPVPTPDRLRTALSLLRECGLLGQGGTIA